MNHRVCLNLIPHCITLEGQSENVWVEPIERAVIDDVGSVLSLSYTSGGR